MTYNFYMTDNESDTFIYNNDNHTIRATLRQFILKVELNYFLHRQNIFNECNTIPFNPLTDRIALYDADNNYMFEIRFFFNNEYGFAYMQWCNDLITNHHSVSQYNLDEDLLAVNTLLRDISITRNYYDYDIE